MSAPRRVAAVLVQAARAVRCFTSVSRLAVVGFGVIALGASAQSSVPPAARAASVAAGEVDRVSHGLFREVQVFRPPGDVTQFVLLLSGADGFAEEDRRRARMLAASGAMVAGISVVPFYRQLEAEGGQCSFASGAFENLAHHLQAYYRLSNYRAPMLVGRGVGATLAYALLAQAEPGTFSSAVTLGFCPSLPFKTPMCKAFGFDSRSLSGAKGSEVLPAASLPNAWIDLQDDRESACAAPLARDFVAQVPQARRVELRASGHAAGVPSAVLADAALRAAFVSLAARTTALQAPPRSLADLPLVEVAATTPPGRASATHATRFAVLLSGDGGWAGLAQGIAKALADEGIPVAGFDSLRYFWTARTPVRTAEDLDRLIRFYAAQWQRNEVLLIGYSQGADVLPFAINRLPASTRAVLGQTVLIGLGKKASFEFHIGNWIGKSGDYPILPEALKLEAARTLCIYGSDERDSSCPLLAPTHARPLALPGGHHFGGDYAGLARLLLQQLPQR